MSAKQIVQSTRYTSMLEHENYALQQAMDQFSSIIRENEELRAKIEGYEKYIKILESQIKIAENIILNNNK